MYGRPLRSRAWPSAETASSCPASCSAPAHRAPGPGGQRLAEPHRLRRATRGSRVRRSGRLRASGMAHRRSRTTRRIEILGTVGSEHAEEDAVGILAPWVNRLKLSKVTVLVRGVLRGRRPHPRHALGRGNRACGRRRSKLTSECDRASTHDAGALDLSRSPPQPAWCRSISSTGATKVLQGVNGHWAFRVGGQKLERSKIGVDAVRNGCTN
jgi:hypothetical protein